MTPQNQWCAKNRLTIHPEKTKAMILNRHKFIGPLNELNLGEQMIECTHLNALVFLLIANWHGNPRLNRYVNHLVQK